MCEDSRKRLTIGIDVGGTNTDGVLYDARKREIAAFTKEPTNHLDYKSSIEAAIGSFIRGVSPQEIISLNISTTLATNAILEGKGSPVALILIGYDDFPHIKNEILSVASPSAFISVRGGHTAWGEERAPLEKSAVAKFAKEHAGEFFAVSSLYSPRNPAHEAEAAALIKREGCAGITCGHEMARSKLNSVKRTISAYLNSSLIDVTRRLIGGVELCAASHGLSCPVMFVRSDSSLVCGSWCSRFPLEALFSGPAAGVRGAMLLAGVKDGDAVIADMGGTSTDIGEVRRGKAVFSESGAEIGAYRTMIPSLEIRSIALGGDSRVSVTDGGALEIGPERGVPCCRAAAGEDCAYTPTDALAALGVPAPGDSEKSLAASAELGKLMGLSGGDFARAVRREVSKRLSYEFARSEAARRVCVGAPAPAYAEAAGCAVPELAEIASAVGAASSSLSLSCSVSLQRSFFDGKFYAFLPEEQIKGEEFEDVLARSRAALAAYLTKSAAQMGFEGASVEIREEYEYIGKEKAPRRLASAILSGQAFIQNAQ